MKGVMRYIVVCLVAIFFAACNVTRNLPEGSYLLSRVVVEPDEATPRTERITEERDDIMKHVRQTPNKRFLGLNFYVWIYEHANPEKDNWWNNLKRKVGEEPVVLNMNLTEKSVQNLETYMRTRGYYSSSVTYDVDTLRRRRVGLTYKLKQEAPMRISSFHYNFRDTSLRTVILADTQNSLVRCGDILDITELDMERNRITKYLNNRGYFDFTANNISYEVDTLGRRDNAAVRMIIEPMLVDYDDRGVAIYEDNSIYRISTINVYPTYDPMLRSTGGFKQGAKIDTTSYGGLNIIRDVNFSPQLRDIVLLRTIPLQPNTIYSADEVQKCYNELMSLGFFRNAKMNFQRASATDNFVTYLGTQKSDASQFVDIREKYLDCNIYCTPALKQSMKVEVEASSTSTFYGLSATVGYTNNNVFRGAEAFDIAARFGFEFMYAPEVAKRSAQELNITAGLSFPRFLMPVHLFYSSNVMQPRTRLEFAFDFQNRPYYRRNIFTARWAYSWRYRERSSFVVRPIDINWIDVKSVDERFLADIDNKYLRTSFESQLNAGLSASYVYNTQRSNLDRTSTLFRANVETSGNLIQGLEALFSKHAAGKDYYEVLGIRYSQYVRTDLGAAQSLSTACSTAEVLTPCVAGCLEPSALEHRRSLAIGYTLRRWAICASRRTSSLDSLYGTSSMVRYSSMLEMSGIFVMPRAATLPRSSSLATSISNLASTQVLDYASMSPLLSCVSTLACSFTTLDSPRVRDGYMTSVGRIWRLILVLAIPSNLICCDKGSSAAHRKKLITLGCTFCTIPG